MTAEVVAQLITDSEGAYLDLTVGMGGHLRALSQALGQSARLYGVDRDAEAVAATLQNLKDVHQFRTAVTVNYAEIDTVVDQFGERAFDGILLDLGLSSRQLDDPERGFSFRHDSPLDMRFDPDAGGRTAADLINALEERELSGIIRRFGEERNAARLARAIVMERQQRMILTTADLTAIVRDTVRGQYQVKSLARVFQAFRIAVNGELDALETVLPKALNLLNPGGRLGVIAYHSLEDRLVKRFIQDRSRGCICPREFPACVCNHKPELRAITRRVIKPQESEQQANPRARSARLRVAEKLAA